MPIDGIKSYQAKGKWYHYDRMTGERIKAEIGTPEFLAEVTATRATMRQLALPPGTLGDVIERYKAADAYWGALKPATKSSYMRAFVALDALKRAPLAAMTRPAILKMRDEALAPKHGRWLANYAVTILGLLFKFAVDQGIVAADPLAEKVRKIRRPKDAPRANRPWTADERGAVLAVAPPHVALPLAMAMCTGLRRTDLFALTLSAVKDGEISVRTSKRDHPVKIPIHPLLAAAIERRPKSDSVQIAVTARGAPWAPSGFDTVWYRLRTRLEAEGKVEPGLTLHGLRHTLGTMLKEAGIEDGEIADVLGQSGTSMARHYSREAGLPEKTKAAVVGLNLTGRKATKPV